MQTSHLNQFDAFDELCNETDAETVFSSQLSLQEQVNKTKEQTSRVNRRIASANKNYSQEQTQRDQKDVDRHFEDYRTAESVNKILDDKYNQLVREYLSPLNYNSTLKKSKRNELNASLESIPNMSSDKKTKKQQSNEYQDDSDSDYDNDPVEILKRWGISFSNAEEDDPEEFLERLEDYKKCLGISSKKVLCYLPIILEGRALMWYRGIQSEINYNWNKFVKAFKLHFCESHDDYDLIDKLRKRIQAPDESITAFILDFRCIVKKFSKPPSEKEQVGIAYKNLFPECRKFLRGYDFSTIDDLIHFGRKYEKEKYLDERYYRIREEQSSEQCNSSEYSESTMSPTDQLDNQESRETNVGLPTRVIQPAQECSTSKMKRNKNYPLTAQARASLLSLGGRCLNCLQHGHKMNACTNRKTENFCYRCGTRRVTTRNCYNCHPQQ